MSCVVILKYGGVKMKKILEDKRNKVILGIGSICILAIVMAVSYAYFTFKKVTAKDEEVEA